MDDQQLLNDYIMRNSEDAFRTLVERHAPMVYRVAMQRVRNPYQAEEVTQAVFVALARKAARLSPRTVLSGWLFNATRFAALNLLREESRRQYYEQEAAVTESMCRPDETESVPEQISPLLIDALESLSRKDREAILIRFFENKSHKEIASTLGVTEVAARVRVSRAVEKLRAIFLKRGFATPSAALLAALSAHNASAVPGGLTMSVTAAALAKGAGEPAMGLAREILKFMKWSQFKGALAISAVILFVGAATGVVLTQVGGSQPGEHITADRATPKGTMLVMEQALENGDTKTYVDSISFRTAEESQLKPVMEAWVEATAQFNRAMSRQFGAETAHNEFPNLPFALPREIIESATEKIQGDSATLSFAGGKGGRPIEFAKLNSEWKMAAGGFIHLKPDVMKDLYSRVIRALNQTTPEIPQGKYLTAREAIETLKQRAR